MTAITQREDSILGPLVWPAAIPVEVPQNNKVQVGGDHYKKNVLQHWDIVALCDLDYFQAQILRYVMRWKDKDGMKDLKKGRHFINKYIELEELRAKDTARYKIALLAAIAELAAIEAAGVPGGEAPAP